MKKNISLQYIHFAQENSRYCVDGKGLEAVLSRATITILLGNSYTLNEKYKTYTFPFLTRLGTLCMKYGLPRRAEKVLIERKSSHLSQQRSRTTQLRQIHKGHK
jgi:hypothetical protein